MISVLIPVFNTDISLLINELQCQKVRDKISCEIIVFDDGSTECFKELNRKTCLANAVIYKELGRNYGRGEIRIKLANAAKFDWLLFIDSDSAIIKRDFLITYINSVSNCDVVVGGTVYSKKVPPCDRRLHWKYGKYREITTARKKTFRSNNFCVWKSLFVRISIPVELTGYGHEDTYIGIQLEKVAARINYIDNPVLHLGIENAEIFIQKSENALKNLLGIRKYTDEKTLRRHVTLFDIYCKALSVRLFITLFYTILKPALLRNLKSCNPKLFLFDFYRLSKLIELSRQY